MIFKYTKRTSGQRKITPALFSSPLKKLLLRKTLELFLVCWTIILFIPQCYAIVNMQALHFDEHEKGIGGST